MDRAAHQPSLFDNNASSDAAAQARVRMREMIEGLRVLTVAPWTDQMGSILMDGAFKRAYLHFPDPWWKKRHTKRLVMGDVFLTEIARLLEPGGELYIQTDVEERAQQYEAQVLACERFAPSGDTEGSARMAENPYGARSPREHRAIADGLPVNRMRFVRA